MASDKEPPDLRDRTLKYARGIVRLFVALPRSTLAQTLGKQMLRSGTSVGANYREAFRSRSRAEFSAKIGDSLKEIEETACWIDLIEAEKIYPTEKLSRIRQETDELIAIFVSIRKKHITTAITTAR